MKHLILDKVADEKFRVGEALDDDELDRLIAFYQTADALVEQLGTVFHLPSRELHNRLIRLLSCKAARLET